MSQNRLLNELFSNFTEIIFNKSKFLVDIQVSDTQYEHFKSQNNNAFYFFNN